MQTQASPRLFRGPRVAVYLCCAVAALALAVMPGVENALVGDAQIASALDQIDGRTVVFLSGRD